MDQPYRTPGTQVPMPKSNLDILVETIQRDIAFTDTELDYINRYSSNLRLYEPLLAHKRHLIAKLEALLVSQATK
jgi:hypothetical protein